MSTPLVVLIGSDTSSPLYKFEYIKGHIRDFGGMLTSALTGAELAVDRIEFTISLDKYYRTLYSPTDADAYQDTEERVYAVREETSAVAKDLLSLPYATPVRYYLNDQLLGKFYSSEVERKSYTEVKITAVSALGILDKQRHLGGMYSGEIIGTVLNDVIGGAVPYGVAEDVASIRIYNWLPIESKREALHQITFAHGINITKDSEGDIVFSYLQQTEAQQIPRERCFNNGKSVYTPPATSVTVTEHTFFNVPGYQEEVLIDNSGDASPADSLFVSFNNAPIVADSIRATDGLSVDTDEQGNPKKGVNYAIVSGIGKLYGRPYAHTANQITRNNTEAPEGAQEKLVQSEGCTLISVLNSSNVSRRLLSYYKSAQTVTMDIEIEGEKPGEQITVESPFRESVTGFLASMQYKITGFLRANCDIVTNYTPTPPGGGDYTHVDVVSISGPWVVPEGVTEATVVLIGGGSGGSGGKNGNNGADSMGVVAYKGRDESSSGGVGGTGGAPGNSGAGGKVFQFHLEATPGETFSVTVGAGGAGGASGGNAGSAGGDTTFSKGGIVRTSASGVSLPSGYYDVIEQKVYGASGQNGARGGNGGAGATPDFFGSGTGERGENVGANQGGEGGSGSRGWSGSGTLYSKPKPGSVWYDEELFDEGDSDFKPSIYGYLFPEYSPSSGDVFCLDQEFYDFLMQSDDVEVDPYTGEWRVSYKKEEKIIRYDEVPPRTYSDVLVSPVYDGTDLEVYQYYSPVGDDWVKIYIGRARSIAEKTNLGYLRSSGGGGGGGAASGANGKTARNRNGADGASALSPGSAQAPGTGGAGGNGGGGGGGGGGVFLSVPPWSDSEWVSRGGNTGGSGGSGSAGGDGAPGCALIYY